MALKSQKNKLVPVDYDPFAVTGVLEKVTPLSLPQKEMWKSLGKNPDGALRFAESATIS